MSSSVTTEQFAKESARLAADLKCEDVVLFDVRGLSQVCDFIVVASGTSQRQMKSVAHQIDELGEELGHALYRSSADDGTTWVIVDFVDLVVHLFEPDQRLYYDLEALWSDAPRLDWRRPGEPSGRDRAAMR